MRHTLSAILLAAAVGAPAGAWAHAHLTSAEPAVGGTVAGPPGQVEIGFSEAVEPRFSTIAVTDAGGRAIATGAAKTGRDDTHLAVTLPPLPPGTYHVAWHAVSVDTHRTEGSFDFTIRP